MNPELYDHIRQELEHWYESQQDQTDGLEYEGSFVELWRHIGQEVMQESMGDIPKSKNKKKV